MQKTEGIIIGDVHERFAIKKGSGSNGEGGEKEKKEKKDKSNIIEKWFNKDYCQLENQLII